MSVSGRRSSLTGSLSAQVIPQRIGRYELIAPIGAGGMASVYVAKSRGAGGFERNVAIKVLHPHLRTLGAFAAELVDEARFAANIQHPNVVTVFDVGDDPAGMYLVMEYIDGVTLSSFLGAAIERGITVPPQVLARILCDALAGLHAAHELVDQKGRHLGLVHRDFSPQNLLIDVKGITRLTDFGVVKALGRSSQTETGLTKGKVAYMSPDQVRGESLDRRVDVWAAGVVAWECFANRRLFGGGEDVTAMMKILNETAPRLASLGLALPEGLDGAVASALERDASRRCPTAEQLRRAILRAFDDRLAEPEEVAHWVKELCGDRLAHRREQLIQAETSQPALRAVGTDAEAQHTTSSRELTESTSVSTPRARRESSRRRNLVIGSVLGLGALIGIAAAATRRSEATPSPVIATSEAAPSPSAATGPSATEVTATPAPTATTSAPLVVPAPLGCAAPLPRGPAAPRGGAIKPSKPKTPGLADSPYERP